MRNCSASMDVVYLLCSTLLLLMMSCFFLLPPPHNKKLPPGPRRWPLVGNLPQISRKSPHADMASLARAHGPLLSLRMGTELVVVASSPAAVMEIFKTQDKIISSRFIPHTYRIKNYAPYSLVFAADCDHRWKSVRSICKSELFTVKTLDLQSQMREEKVSQLVCSLAHRQGKEVKIAELVFRTIFNIMGNVILSKDVFEEEKNAESNSLKNTFSRMLELGLCMNVADYFPKFSMLDLQGLNRESIQHIQSVYQVWDALIEDRKKDSKTKLDFFSILQSANLEHKQILALFTDMFIAGTDTTTNTIEWTMSEMMKHPEMMAKAKNELERVVGQRNQGKNMVNESHLNQLNYIHACIKETLRRHPIAGLILRRAKEECKVMGYTIPKDTRVIVNVWAVGRDPDVWSDPEKFLPERFMESGKDYKGNDFDFTPFGGGRRICPGMPLASRLLLLVIASLIHTFDWSLPMGMKPEELDMEEKFGIVIEKAKPLVLIPNAIIV